MKHKSDKNGTVYSTNPDYAFDYGEEEVVTLEPAKQNLRVMLDKKQRGGSSLASKAPTTTWPSWARN